MKQNPWQFEAAPLRKEDVEIVYPDGNSFTVTLRELSITQATAAAKQGAFYAGAFAGRDEQGNQRAFAPPFGEPVPLEEEFCESAAAIEAMQVQEERFTFAELVGLAEKMKEEYLKLAAAAGRVQTGGAALNPPAAGGAPSSVPHSTTIKRTPPSPGKSDGSSGQSTNGSGDSAAPLPKVERTRGKTSQPPATAT